MREGPVGSPGARGARRPSTRRVRFATEGMSTSTVPSDDVVGHLPEISDMPASRMEAVRMSDSSLGTMCSTKSQRESMLKMYETGALQRREATPQERVQLLTMSAPWIGLQLAGSLTDFTVVCFMSGDKVISFWLNVAAVLVCVVYCLDIYLRVFSVGATVFFESMWNRLDSMVVLLTCVGTGLTVLGLAFPRISHVALLGFARVVRLMRLVRTSMLLSRTCPVFRRITGENKRRLVSPLHDLDLDLVYVTPRLISMSVPASDFLTRLYRNPLPEVVRFFETFHAGHYLIVNACPEIRYAISAFRTGQVEFFYVPDHSPPLLEQLLNFLRVARRWIAFHPDNVLAVHCRGGKGRTGSFCCAWLLYSHQAEDAKDALNFYAVRRTDMQQVGTMKVQGVETPSQVRYLEYVERLLRQQVAFYPLDVQLPPVVELRLCRLTISNLFRKEVPSELTAVVHEVMQKRPVCVCAFSAGSCDLEGAVIRGDVRISICTRGTLPAGVSVAEEVRQDLEGLPIIRRRKAKKSKGCLFYFLFHTSFLEGDRIRLPTSLIDRACKKPKLYRNQGVVELSFSRS